MVWLQVLWCLTVVCVAAWLVVRFRESSTADHAKCTALVSSVVSNHVFALRLRELAAYWDSAEGQTDLTRIRNTKYEAGGPSVVGIWLREQAEAIDPQS